MKNLFSNLAAFFVGVLICVSVLACANDSEEVNSSSDGNAIAVMQNQISKLTSKIEELEGKLAEAETKIDNIEDEIDYELVFQKFNQYFEGCDCNYDAEIEELKNKIDNINILSADELFPKITNYNKNDPDEHLNFTTAYDSMGRLTSFTSTEINYASELTFTYKASVTYNNNQCIVVYDDDKAVFVIDCSKISTPALNYFLLAYFISFLY